MSTLMFKIVGGDAPFHLRNNLIFMNEVNKRVTRNNDPTKLYLPGANLEVFKESLSYKGAETWNSLFSDIRSSKNIQAFKNKYKEIYWND